MTTKHEHATHEHATPHDAASDLATAARHLYGAAERLGPRLTEHGYGCPALMNGACTCGVTDFLAAMRELGVALAALAPQNGG